MSNAVKMNIGPSAEEQAQAQAATWLRAPVNRVYTNGFAIAQSTSDISVIMLVNGAPNAIVSMSFISAKTLILELGKALSALETGLGQPILTMEEVAAKLQMQPTPTSR